MELKALVEIETESGVIGIATGLGGEPACWLINNHFRRFLIGQDLRNINMIWDQMYRASMFYGRKGLPVIASLGVKSCYQRRGPGFVGCARQGA